MPADPLFIGLDMGTSGARAVAIDGAGMVRAEGKARIADTRADKRDPTVWWRAAETALVETLSRIERGRVAAISVDGTSGTMLPVDAMGNPLAAARMYDDPCADCHLLDRIAREAPVDSAAHGATSGLAKAILFQAAQRPHRIVHQADWIAGRLSGLLRSDENNSLKTGYDPLAGCWPDWMGRTGVDAAILPEVVAPGTPVGTITRSMAAALGLRGDVRIVAGTTDGCASFLATGADSAGDGVSALGSTLTLKILSDEPVFAPQYGIYSHKLLGKWLAGGASNTGGRVLLSYFSTRQLKYLSAQIDPGWKNDFGYYPLLEPGERFPIADPNLQPRLSPRPDSDAAFLYGLLDGIAGVEALGYSRLAELGAPELRALRSVGGGAGNPAWTRIRQRRLDVTMPQPVSDQAAYGAALLARLGGLS